MNIKAIPHLGLFGIVFKIPIRLYFIALSGFLLEEKIEEKMLLQKLRKKILYLGEYLHPAFQLR